jgi:hypothetical protein
MYIGKGCLGPPSNPLCRTKRPSASLRVFSERVCFLRALLRGLRWVRRFRPHGFEVSFQSVERLVVERRVRRHLRRGVHGTGIDDVLSEVILRGQS